MYIYIYYLHVTLIAALMRRRHCTDTQPGIGCMHTCTFTHTTTRTDTALSHTRTSCSINRVCNTLTHMGHIRFLTRSSVFVDSSSHPFSLTAIILLNPSSVYYRHTTVVRSFTYKPLVTPRLSSPVHFASLFCRLPARIAAPALIAMVKTDSKISKTLTRRDVLLSPGGKGAFRKHAGGTFHPKDTKTPWAKELECPSPKALKWVNVVAPAYISGSLRLYPSPA